MVRRVQNGGKAIFVGLVLLFLAIIAGVVVALWKTGVISFGDGSAGADTSAGAGGAGAGTVTVSATATVVSRPPPEPLYLPVFELRSEPR